MINRDWEKFGEDIRRTVQDAIDSQDFGKLNQTITNTINDAVDNISKNIRNVHGGNGFRQYGYGPKEYAHNGRRPDEQRPDGQAFRRQDTGTYQKKRLPELYRRTTSVKVGGTVMTALGMTMGGVFSVLFLLFIIGPLITRDFELPQIMATAVFLILAAAGFVTGGCGTGIRSRVKRFQTYIRVLGQREYCNIQELSKAVKKNTRYVVKDIEDMFSRGWFLQGHLDEQKTCLIVSDGMYQQYLQIEANRRQNEMEAADQDKRSEKKTRKDSSEEARRRSKLPQEVREIIEEGDAYIRKIHECNDAIPGPEISAKISRMEVLADRIFDRVEQNPESVDDIRKLMEYYLPTTVKLLEAYRELDAQPVAGENIRSSKMEIEATLDTLNVAFEKLLDSMFQETAWDVSSDISVLQTLLAQEGLTEDGLGKR